MSVTAWITLCFSEICFLTLEFAVNVAGHEILECSEHTFNQKQIVCMKVV